MIPDISTQKSILSQQKRCFNCLSLSHIVINCRSMTNCLLCRGRHHTSICVKNEASRIGGFRLMERYGFDKTFKNRFHNISFSRGHLLRARNVNPVSQFNVSPVRQFNVSHVGQFNVSPIRQF